MLKQIDGRLLKRMIISASNNLENNIEIVNELNVFPVPDGDTGTNMSLTLSAAAKEIKLSDSSSISNISNILSTASLRGARGNSGVILSQLFRGFAKGLKGLHFADAKTLAKSVQQGVSTAYKAGMKPIEGTILTVAREGAQCAFEISRVEQDITKVLEVTIEKSKETLKRTTDMLAVLKQAGVVDAGGKGLVYILEGALYALKYETEINVEEKKKTEGKLKQKSIDIGTDDIKFIYCTEFLINKFEKTANINKFKTDINKYGDSIFVIDDSGIVKLHMHTNEPGTIMQQALKLGELTNIKIDNMKEQHENIIIKQKTEEKPVKNKKYGFIAVAAGRGLINIFKELGADKIIEGGQSMNPSTEEILKAVNEIHADNIFILCNNKNIIAAAQQMETLTDKNTIVIPSKSIPQGIASMIAFNLDLGIEENKQRIFDILEQVKTGQITHAIRDSIVEDKQISKGDILGLKDGKIDVVNVDIDIVCHKLLESLVDEESSIISIYFGEDIEESQAIKISKDIEEKFSDCDVEVHYGGQPLYYYIFSVE